MSNYSYNFNAFSSDTPRGINNPSTSVYTPVRVVDVILEGPNEEIGAIYYRSLLKDIDQTDKIQLPKAYPLNASFKQVPLPNEVVLLMSAPSEEIGSSNATTKHYYTTVVSMWNHPHHNAFPDQVQNPGEVNLGRGFTELSDINPLHPFPGDILLEGRQGQSIRFTGANHPSSSWVDSSNVNKPLLILSNGQRTTDNGYDFIVEDINQDDSSLYFTSDHIVNLQIDKDLLARNTFTVAPINQNTYKGKQLIGNADRVVLNARNSDILLTSKESTSVNAKTINLESKEYTCLDSKYIYLGTKALQAPLEIKEPVLLGNQVERFLEDLLSILDDLSSDLARAQTIGGEPIPLLNKRGIVLKSTLTSLKTLINPNGPSTLKSKKVFTE